MYNTSESSHQDVYYVYIFCTQIWLRLQVTWQLSQITWHKKPIKWLILNLVLL